MFSKAVKPGKTSDASLSAATGERKALLPARGKTVRGGVAKRGKAEGFER